MIKLNPIKDKDSYHRAIYKEIKSLLEKTLFFPIMMIAEGDILENASSNALLTALRKGEIAYADGQFTGKFNSAIGLELRKIGASWDKSRKSYRIASGNVPAEVKAAAARGIADTQERVNKIKVKLDSLQKKDEIPFINFNKQVEGILLDVDGQFKTTIPKNIGLPMATTGLQKQILRDEYIENINLYIQKMTQESAQRLRGKILKHVEQGGRAADLVPLILSQKGVSDRHALFLAKQETSILVSTYRDSRYREAGIDKYVWSTSHDSRVRPDHRKLNKHKFKFNEPPETNSVTKARNNPGYDYGCRCVAIPVID